MKDLVVRFVCPRCKQGNTEDYGEIFECCECGKEFSVLDFLEFEDKTELLTEQEKKMAFSFIYPH